MVRKKPLHIIISILLLALSLAAWHTYTAQKQAAKVLTGTVEATKADITAKSSGYIQELYIKEGDTVQKGTPAARLERKDLEAALLRDQAAYAQAKSHLKELENGTRSEELQEAAAKTAAAETALKKADRDLARAASLLENGAIAQSFYDDAATTRDTAAAQLKASQQQEARLQNGTRQEEIETAQEEVSRTQSVIAISQAALDDLLIYSPLAGTILTKNFEPGEYVNTGAAIATITDLSDCWVKVYVSSAELGQLHIGQTASVQIDSMPGQTFSGKIRDINSQAEYTPRQSITKNERANLVFAVKVAIDNPDGIMKPGMPADVIFDE